jgi:hypothetical protein
LIFPESNPVEEAKESPNPHLILPVGTQVVTIVDLRSSDDQSEPLRRSGTVGKIIKAKWPTAID